MTSGSVGTVIATRKLSIDGKQIVEVLIGKPQPLPDGNDWYCPYQIQGIGSGKIRRSGGIDAVQALILALQDAGAWLVSSPEFEAGKLSWDSGAVKGDLGFPVPKNIQDVLPPGANERSARGRGAGK